MKVALCIPTRKAPFPQMVEAIEASLPLLRGAGHTVGVITEIGSAYISWAVGQMVAKAMLWEADAAVIIEDDMSFDPQALLRLIEMPGDVVAGNYRYKFDPVEYMAIPTVVDGKVHIYSNGCIKADKVPAGFLKITRRAVERFRKHYPSLICDDHKRELQFVDLFNHGAYQGVWFGQDFAFSRRWRAAGEDIWVIPDLNISHWLKQDDGTYTEFPGNYLQFLRAEQAKEEAQQQEAA